MAIYSYSTAKEGKLYGIRFRIAEDGVYVHKNLRGFKTQKAAKIAEYEYRQKVERAAREKAVIKETTPSFTLSQIWDKYFEWATNNLAPSSLYCYRSVYDKFIAPTFGAMDIAKITKRQITAWQDKLPADLGYRYKSRIRTTLSAVFTYAVNRDYVDNNPVSAVEKLRKTEQTPKLDYWTKEEFDQFIAVVESPLYKAFFSFLYVSGCRKGEAFALRWSDFDFDNNTVSITKSITKKGDVMARQLGKPTTEKTKNKKHGSIYMPKSVMDMIAVLPRKEYVFGGERPLSETHTARVFNEYIRQAKVKRIRLHDLRHSCAALLISCSPSSELAVLYAIAARLRDSVDQILKTYGHLFPSRQSEVINTFNSLF